MARLAEGRIERAYGGRLATKLPQARGALPGAGASFVEPVEITSRPVLLFGAGHVGQAMARVFAGLPLSLGWFDVRPELAGLPGLVCCTAEEMQALLAEAPPEAAVLVLTHDHQLDYALVRAALSGPAGFVGMIGSGTKRSRFLARLAADGVDPARLTCPIGLAGVAGKQPEVIAVSVAAQLLSLEGG
ncbi:XdhC family protein [Acidocella sp. MX-AZ03]|uniref:XdhC family protein n=1 Tax=Acidocella sp. MX-AZ03 TaxID=2697363 RepID=UPI0022DE57E3|nr:XdhC family protein [Acidocella sp. MX-AZ03]WBO58159.1 XdhC family protein [Acidocella sp. MX-AZ03]